MCFVQEVCELGGVVALRSDGEAAFGQRGGGEERGAGGDPAQRRTQLPCSRSESHDTQTVTGLIPFNPFRVAASPALITSSTNRM